MRSTGSSLADEAKAAVARAAADAPLGVEARRVLAARRRFLPYVVGGAAFIGAYASLFHIESGDGGGVLMTALTAGFVVGMILGWALLGRGSRMVQRRLPTRIVIVLLTIPAYVAAGWISAWTGWIAVMAVAKPDETPPAPSAWGLLVSAAIVIYPLSYAFARRNINRPDSLVEAIRTGLDELSSNPTTWTFAGRSLIAVLWGFGSFFGVLALLALLQIIIPAYQDSVTRAGAALGGACLLAWIGLTVSGTAWTIRWLSGGRERHG